MAAGPRRPNWLVRQAKAHPTWFATTIVCAAVILLEIAALTNLFGLGVHSGAPPPSTGPNLNPFGVRVVAIESAISYTGPANGYVPALEGQNLCGARCPLYPNESFASSPPHLGLDFFYNLTNTADVAHNLSLPVIGNPPSIPFQVHLMCCYATFGEAYSEWVVGPFSISPDVTIGFEAYVWTTEPLPDLSDGLTLYANFTSN